MNIQPIYLKDNYQAYVNGAEVESDVSTNNRSLAPGQHVMVFKDSLSSETDIPGPSAQKLSDNIGVEGMVTQVDRVTDMNGGPTRQHLRIRRL
ncbi:MAG TPA: hypothetical protein VD816_08105 [Ohtaekwangia sp.]|nr:hypothetical protein [Ohtaekwangia sp.]